MVNNRANYSGGGAFFHLADMLCHGHCNFSNNKADIKGGRIHAISAVITLKHGNKWKASKIPTFHSLLKLSLVVVHTLR